MADLTLTQDSEHSKRFALASAVWLEPDNNVSDLCSGSPSKICPFLTQTV